MPPTLVTPRLVLRALTPADAPFMLALLNDPGFIANIGDRGVRSEAEAARYLAERMLAAYARDGFGFHLVETAEAAIGICGFVRRGGLPAPDLGFAYLARHVRQGYGREAGEAMLRHGRTTLGLDSILAITAPHNRASIALLERLGFAGDERIDLAGIAGPSRLLRHIGGQRPPGTE